MATNSNENGAFKQNHTRWRAAIRLLVWGDETEDGPAKELLTVTEVAQRCGMTRVHLSRLMHQPCYAAFQAMLRAAQEERDKDIHRLAGSRLLARLRLEGRVQFRDLAVLWDKSRPKRPIQTVEHGGIDGAPIQTEAKFDFSGLSDEQLLAVNALLDAGRRGGGVGGAGGDEPAGGG